MEKIKALAFCTALLFFGAVCIHAADEGIAVKPSDLPPAAQKAIHQHVGRGRVQKIAKVMDGEEATYEVEMRKNNRVRSFTVNEDGAMLETEVFLNETPEPVRDAIKKRTAIGELDSISKIFDEGTVSFQVDYTMGGKDRSFTLDDQGELLKLLLFLPETPAPVQRVVEKESSSEKLGEITEVFEGGEPKYEVEIQSGAMTRDVTFDAKGEIVSKEEPVALADVPDPVQKAIREQAKDGHAGKVVRITEGEDISYQTRVHRDGKWQEFDFDTDGKVIE